jgi:hypothetical protein
MDKTKTKKKLLLNRDRLRRLDGGNLQAAAGGSTIQVGSISVCAPCERCTLQNSGCPIIQNTRTGEGGESIDPGLSGGLWR